MSDATTLPCFAEAMRARSDELIERMDEIYRTTLPERFGSMPREQLRELLITHLNAYMDALRDPEARTLLERSRGWFERALEQGMRAEMVSAMNAAMRTVTVDVSLALHAEGVPGAMAGLRRLLDASFGAMRLFDEIYRGHAEKAEAAALVYEALAEHAPDGIAVAGMDGTLIYANPAFRALLRDESIEGHEILSLVLPEDSPRAVDEVMASLLARGTWSGEVRYRRGDGEEILAHLSVFVMRDAEGRGVARCAMVRDLTQEKLAEQERRKLSEEVIRAQEAALRALSTPLVPLGEGVVAMPLLGALDAVRAERMQEVLLDGIGREGARVAILDVTGVKGVDAEVARGLMQAALAARLLGAEVVLSGIRPEVARLLVAIDADFSGVTTTGTLQSAVKLALGRARKARSEAISGALGAGDGSPPGPTGARTPPKP